MWNGTGPLLRPGGTWPVSAVLIRTVGREELGPRDLNPDYLDQNQACCHYTRAHRVPEA